MDASCACRPRALHTRARDVHSLDAHPHQPASRFPPIRLPPQAFGPFTPDREMFNGRAAMVGLMALLAVEALKGSALF